MLCIVLINLCSSARKKYPMPVKDANNNVFLDEDNSDDEAEDDNPSPPPSRSPKKKLVFVRSINWLTFFSPVLRARVTQAVSDTDNKDHDGTASKPGGRYMVASSRSSKNR